MFTCFCNAEVFMETKSNNLDREFLPWKSNKELKSALMWEKPSVCLAWRVSVSTTLPFSHNRSQSLGFWTCDTFTTLLNLLICTRFFRFLSTFSNLESKFGLVYQSSLINDLSWNKMFHFYLQIVTIQCNMHTFSLVYSVLK